MTTTYKRSQRRNWYTRFAYPVLSRIPNPELANEIAKLGLRVTYPLIKDSKADAKSLEIELWGRRFSNPIGAAAGFDKDAEVCRQVSGIGFGFVEVGTVTPRPQAGNSKPRVFRLAADSGIINRMGFPSSGLDKFLGKVVNRRTKGIFGVNIGANKDSDDRLADYVLCASKLAPYADYIVCNVSSPNTSGLRDLQRRSELSELIKRVQNAIEGSSAALLVKIAPDASNSDLDDIVSVCRNLRIAGLIVGNTTVQRPQGLASDNANQTGGLSGSPLRLLSTSVLRETAKRVERQFPLIGCGGVSTGEDAYEKILAGASLIQLYSTLVYDGPPAVRCIKDELADLLARDGFSTVADAVGAGLR